MSILPFLAAAAHAQGTVPIHLEVPPSVPLFDQTIVLKGKGVVAGGDCAGAAAAALADLDANRARYNATHILGIYVAYAPREEPIEEVACTYKGKPEAPKKSIVKIEALGIHAGPPPTYGEVSTARARQIAGALTRDKSVSVAARVMSAPTRALMGGGAREAWTVTEEVRGMLYLPESIAGIEEGFLPEHNRSARAATVYRRLVLPALGALTDPVAAVPEIAGVTLYSSTTHPTAEWEMVTEGLRFVVPSEGILAYHEGTVSAEALLEQVSVEYGGYDAWSSTPVSLASALD